MDFSNFIAEEKALQWSSYINFCPKRHGVHSLLVAPIQCPVSLYHALQPARTDQHVFN